MEPLRTTASRRTRLTLVALALFVLLAIVGFASRSGFGGSSEAQPSPAYVSWAMSIFLVVFVLAIPLTIYAYVVQSREGAIRRNRSFKHFVIQNVLTFGFFILLTALFVYLKRLHPHFPRLDNTPLGKLGKQTKR